MGRVGGWGGVRWGEVGGVRWVGGFGTKKKEREHRKMRFKPTSRRMLWHPHEEHNRSFDQNAAY